VTFVTDTHGFVFYAMGKIGMIGRRARRAFSNAEKRRATVFIPTVCFFELALLLDSGKVRSSLPFPEWKTRVEKSGTFVIEPLTWEDVYEAQGLVALADPFDRLIAGIANRLQSPLITRDSVLVDSGLVETLW
jgi:PIN domain nuclease of toxin-antitoxin system